MALERVLDSATDQATPPRSNRAAFEDLYLARQDNAASSAKSVPSDFRSRDGSDLTIVGTQNAPGELLVAQVVQTAPSLTPDVVTPANNIVPFKRPPVLEVPPTTAVTPASEATPWLTRLAIGAAEVTATTTAILGGIFFGETELQKRSAEQFRREHGYAYDELPPQLRQQQQQVQRQLENLGSSSPEYGPTNAEFAAELQRRSANDVQRLANTEQSISTLNTRRPSREADYAKALESVSKQSEYMSQISGYVVTPQTGEMMNEINQRIQRLQQQNGEIRATAAQVNADIRNYNSQDVDSLQERLRNANELLFSSRTYDKRLNDSTYEANQLTPLMDLTRNLRKADEVVRQRGNVYKDTQELSQSEKQLSLQLLARTNLIQQLNDRLSQTAIPSQNQKEFGNLLQKTLSSDADLERKLKELETAGTQLRSQYKENETNLSRKFQLNDDTAKMVRELQDYDQRLKQFNRSVIETQAPALDSSQSYQALINFVERVGTPKQPMDTPITRPTNPQEPALPVQPGDPPQKGVEPQTPPRIGDPPGTLEDNPDEPSEDPTPGTNPNDTPNHRPVPVRPGDPPKESIEPATQPPFGPLEKPATNPFPQRLEPFDPSKLTPLPDNPLFGKPIPVENFPSIILNPGAAERVDKPFFPQPIEPQPSKKNDTEQPTLAPRASSDHPQKPDSHPPEQAPTPANNASDNAATPANSNAEVQSNPASKPISQSEYINPDVYQLIRKPDNSYALKSKVANPRELPPGTPAEIPVPADQVSDVQRAMREEMLRRISQRTGTEPGVAPTNRTVEDIKQQFRYNTNPKTERAFEEFLSDDGSLLELGSGPKGRIANEARNLRAEQGKDPDTVKAVDLLGDPIYGVERADATNLKNVPDNSVDKVVSFNSVISTAIQDSDVRQRAFDEAGRVLAPGGEMLVGTMPERLAEQLIETYNNAHPDRLYIDTANPLSSGGAMVIRKADRREYNEPSTPSDNNRSEGFPSTQLLPEAETIVRQQVQELMQRLEGGQIWSETNGGWTNLQELYDQIDAKNRPAAPPQRPPSRQNPDSGILAEP
jgi:hypothetical protein